MQQLPSAALQDRSDPEFLQPSTAVSQLKKVKRPRGRVWCPLWAAGVAWEPVWLSQWIVHQASSHMTNDSLESQRKETQVKMFAIFAFTVNFMFPRCEMAARTASPSQGP